MPAKNKKTKHPLRQKRLPLICLGVVICLVAATVFLFVRSRDLGAQKPASRSDFAALQQAVGRVRDGVGGVDTVWHDESSCTDIKPRLFGERERYACTVKFSRAQSILSNEQAKQIVDQQEKTIATVQDVASTQLERYPTIPQQSSADSVAPLGSVSFSLKRKFGKTQTCSIDYKISVSSTNNLEQSVRCFVETDGLLLDTVQEV